MAEAAGRAGVRYLAKPGGDGMNNGMSGVWTGVYAPAAIMTLMASLAPPAMASTADGQELAWLPWAAAGPFVLLALVFAILLVRQRRTLRYLADSFNSIPHPEQVVDRRGRVVSVNRAFARYFPGRIETMPAILGDMAASPEAREDVARLAERSRGGGEGRLELCLGEDGAAQQVWLEVRAQPIAGRGGAVLWSAEDVTTRRQMQETLKAEQARFMDLMDHAPVGFYSVDEAGRLLYVNGTLSGWLGARPGELTTGGLSLHDLAPDAAAGGAAAYNPFVGPECAVGETVHGEARLVGPRGQSFQAYIIQEAVRDDENGTLTTRTVVRNLTSERAVTEALERSERRFRRFFEQAPMGIALLDSGGRISECNTAFARLLDRPAGQLVGQAFVDLLREGDRETAASALAEGTVDGAPPPVVRAQDGERVCTLFATALDGEGEDNGGHVVHLIDATEQKSLEQQFAQSQKMQAVGQLAGGVAHDFNNLLTAIIGFCDLLLLRHRPGDQSFADLMQVKQNANRAANLVRQLLAFSRQQTLRPTVLSVTDVVAELMHLLRRLLGENITLEISHGRDLHSVKVDQGQLEQVIINLAVNARDAMAEGGGHLCIRTRNARFDTVVKRRGEVVPPGDYVLIEMSDTGHGISKDDLDRIFEPFFSTKELGAGTGLGLSTVYGIVKQTGGFIEVDSAEGKGSSFRIYLPRHQEAVEARPDEKADVQEARDLTGVGTLLLVEDEDAVRSFSARALRKKGYNVLEAGSGEQALDLLKERSEPIDLVITDVVMPQIDGPTLVNRIRADRPELKVIFISGYTETPFRKHLDADTNVHFLAKPFSLKQLAATVKEVLHDTAA